MAGYFERKRRQYQDTGFEDLDKIQYGSIIGVLDRYAKREILAPLRTKLFHAGIRDLLNPFSMEVLMMRDPRNIIQEQLPFRSYPAFFFEGDIIKGERKSRLRHRENKLIIKLRGTTIINRLGKLYNLGFKTLNMYAKVGPCLVLKYDPMPSDLTTLEPILKELDHPKVYIEREVWAKYR
ncbi:MAG: hypothetical protein F4W90_05930 [Gammaproteobacteria bacterium]|nr:hypothetical protein [Gammaproteobacteria bacterium]